MNLANSEAVPGTFRRSTLLGGADFDDREGCFSCEWGAPVDIIVEP